MDIELIRQQTRGCSDKIFLNSAGSSLVPLVVRNTMNSYLEQEEQTGGYALAGLYRDEINDFYKQVGKLIRCEETQIAFTTSSTDAYAKAISSIDFKNGDVILTTDEDYISNQFAFLSLKKRFGIKIVRARHLPSGDIDLDDFEKLVQQHLPRLIAITHIPSSSGIVLDAEGIGAISKKYNCWYLLDACQSVGQLLVDVNRIGCDFLTATGRKFLRGPRGTGFLYVSKRVLEAGLAPLVFDLQGAKWINADEYELAATAKRFEFWEFSYAGMLGLKEAIKYANQTGISTIEKYNATLMKNFRQNLQQVRGLNLLDRGTKLSNILTFNIGERSLSDLEQLLQTHHVYYSVSFKSSSLIDFTKKGIEWAIRFSPHYFNTSEELEKVTAFLS